MAFVNADTASAATQVKKFDGATGSGGVQLNDNFDALNSRTLDNAANIATNTSDIATKAPLASPTFTGTPAAPTATAGTNTTQIATTAFVATSFAPLASPTFTGSVVAPAINGGTAANDDLTLQGTSHSTRTSSYVNIQPNGGNVGIGITAPAANLHVYNNDNTTNGLIEVARFAADESSFQFGGPMISWYTNGGSYTLATLGAWHGASYSDPTLRLQVADSSHTLQTRLTISSGGKVTINNLLNLQTYTNSSPADGDLWFDGTDLKFRVGGVTKTVTLT